MSSSTVVTQTPSLEVHIRIEGRAGRITLDRPKALNALTLDMVRRIWTALRAWKDDPAVQLIILDGAGERGLCAGGDVRSLYDARAEGSGFARTFWREEYRLNALIHRYPKPYVALMDGIVMGGGIGLSAHAQGGTRVVTERSRIAFPETTIGLIPDVGGTWLLSRAPKETGPYLALMGTQMGAADAIYTGFADVHVPSACLPAIIERLTNGTETPQAILATFAVDPGLAPLLGPLGTDVTRYFAAPDIDSIAAALARDATADEFAKRAHEGLAARSPLALKTTLEALKRARGYPDLEAALAVEFRLCTHLYETGEFPEGVRALIVDKDRKPQWSRATLADVTPEIVDALFAPLPASEEPFAAPS
jgi:enoyl-CoA hydratase